MPANDSAPLSASPPSGPVAFVPESLQPPFRRVLRVAADAWNAFLGDRLISLILFGSVARGTAQESSDLDLLVILEQVPRSLRERRRILLEVWERERVVKGLPASEWNLVVKSPDEAQSHSPLYLDIVEDGIILLDRGRFFEQILDEMRERMRILGSRRVYLADGSWYWDLKPSFRFGEVVEI